MCASIGGYISEEIHSTPHIIDIVLTLQPILTKKMHLAAWITLLVAIYVQLVQSKPLSPPNPSILTSLDGNYSSLMASLRNTTNSPVGVNSIETQCSEIFGLNPVFSDCQSARDYISPDVVQYSWGNRHTGLPGNVFPLPYRIMGRKLLRKTRSGSPVTD